MSYTRRRFVLAARPQGVPQPADFRLEEDQLPDLQDGEILIDNAFVSVDPGMRSRLSAASYAPVLGLGETVESAGVGRVRESRNPKFSPGQWVSGGFGWTDRVLSTGKGVLRLDPALYDGPVKPTAAIGILGIPGLTAYFGLIDLGSPKEGEILYVSSAAGTVGATAGQIGKILGLTVIGSAGGAEKCAYVKSLGFDHVIDRHQTPDLTAALRAAAPRGMDIYLDNVGGPAVDSAIANMRPKGRIVISGQISEYNRPEPVGIRNTLAFITHRLRMEGLVVFDYGAQFGEAQAKMAGWIRDGRLSFREDIVTGIENLPGAFAGLFSGDAIGRKLVAVSPA